MTNHELDVLVAEKVMGFGNAVKVLNGRYGATIEGYVDHWSTDSNAAVAVLKQIHSLGLHLQFSDRALFFVGGLHLSRSREAWWRLLNISPRQICEAALECVGVDPETGAVSSHTTSPEAKAK
jgi:hypothetical protein